MEAMDLTSEQRDLLDTLYKRFWSTDKSAGEFYSFALNELRLFRDVAIEGVELIESLELKLQEKYESVPKRDGIE